MSCFLCFTGFSFVSFKTLTLFCSPGSINACERTSFAFLRQELPVRLANIMKEINLLPDRLLATPSVQLVQSWWDIDYTTNDWLINGISDWLVTDLMTCLLTDLTCHCYPAKSIPFKYSYCCLTFIYLKSCKQYMFKTQSDIRNFWFWNVQVTWVYVTLNPWWFSCFKLRHSIVLYCILLSCLSIDNTFQTCETLSKLHLFPV